MPHVDLASEFDIDREDIDMISCLEKLFHNYFVRSRPLVVSLPPSEPILTPRYICNLRPYNDISSLANNILETLNENMKWPIQVSSPSSLDEIPELPHLHQSYLFFLWKTREDDTLIEVLENEVEMLRYSPSWNPRAVFIVIMTYYIDEDAKLMALHVHKSLWEEYKVVKVLVVISNSVKDLQYRNYSKVQEEYKGLELYTASPYSPGRIECGTITDVISLSALCSTISEQPYMESYVFPSRTMNNFHGCPIRIGIILLDPYVSEVDNYTNVESSLKYRFRGISIELPLIAFEHMNLSIHFLSPSKGITLDSYTHEFGNVKIGDSDILLGAIPLMPVTVTSSFETTVPYVFEQLKWFVPCPRPIRSVQQIILTYTISVWCLIAVVIMLVSCTIWLLGKRYNYSISEYLMFSNLYDCFYISWSIFIGVSISKMPKTSMLRTLVFLYICYSFAIVTVFQAYFMSYLVEPSYEKRITTFDHLINSGLAYGANDGFKFLVQTMALNISARFGTNYINCGSMSTCVERVMSSRDITTLCTNGYAHITAIKMGAEHVEKVLCSLDEKSFSGSIIALVPRGSPFLERLNTLISRSLESGLFTKFWNEYTLNILLSTKAKFDNDSDEYVSFEINHLASAFWVLVIGLGLGCVLCILEIAYHLTLI
ncbi:Ionotropic receptor 600 [Blattella germanica]|nr:Ionotropic receptor 600 [Blattella germanica]